MQARLEFKGGFATGCRLRASGFGPHHAASAIKCFATKPRKQETELEILKSKPAPLICLSLFLKEPLNVALERILINDSLMRLGNPAIPVDQQRDWQ